MAQYRCSVKNVLSRGKGASVSRSLAYVMREKIEDERTGESFDYSGHKDKALFKGVFAPQNAPDWVRDFKAFANEIERAEKRKDAQLALPIELSLAHELTLEQNQWMMQDFIKENFTRKGYAVAASIHEPPHDGDERNIHAHLLVSLRTIDENGFAKTKHAQQENYLNRTERTEAWRQSWEKQLKHHLTRHGFEKEASEVSCLSLEAQGIEREATKHLGPTAAYLERHKDGSDRGDINREIEARNKERERLELEARMVGLELTELAKSDTKREALNAAFKNAHIAADRADDFATILQRRGFSLTYEGGSLLAHDSEGNVFPADEKDFGGLFPEKLFYKLHKHFEEQKENPPQIENTASDELTHKEKADSRKAATLYDRADMVSQQHDAMRHLKDREKQARKVADVERREEAHGKAQDSFADRKGADTQKREDRNARTEQTDAKRAQTQKEILKEIFETKFGRGHNEQDREAWGRERERER